MLKSKLFTGQSTEEIQKEMNDFLAEGDIEYEGSCAAGTGGVDTYIPGGTSKIKTGGVTGTKMHSGHMVKGCRFIVVLFYREKS